MIRKALSTLFLAEIVGRVLSFVVIVYVAKVLGPQELGYWSYALAINAFLIIASSLGLETYAMVECAKDLSKRPQVLSQVFALRLLLFSFVLLLLIFFHSLFDPKAFTLLLLLLMGDYVASLTPRWFFQVEEDFEAIAKVKLIQAISYGVLIGILFFFKTTIYFLALAYLGSFLIALLFYFPKIFKEFDPSLVHPKQWGRVLRVAFYLGGALFLNQIYTNTDKIMITKLLGIEYTGYYEAGYKLYALLAVIFGLVWTVYAPKVAREKSVFRPYFWTILLLGIAGGAVFYLFRDWFIPLLYSDHFSPTKELMAYFALSGVVLALSFALSSPLPLLDKPKAWFWITLFSASLNVGLNFAFIPFLGAKGAIVATIVCEGVVALLAWKEIKGVLGNI